MAVHFEWLFRTYTKKTQIYTLKNLFLITLHSLWGFKKKIPSKFEPSQLIFTSATLSLKIP